MLKRVNSNVGLINEVGYLSIEAVVKIEERKWYSGIEKVTGLNMMTHAIPCKSVLK